MAPADQRFHAQQASGAQIHDRLVFEEELLLVDGPADIRFQAQPLVQHILHLRLEHRVPVLTRRLRVIHGDVGVTEQ